MMNFLKKFRLPWTREHDETVAELGAAAHTRVQAERQAAALESQIARTNWRRSENHFGRDLEIRKFTYVQGAHH